MSPNNYRKGAKIAVCAVLVAASVLVAGCSSRASRAKNYYEKGTSYLAKHEYVKARIEFRNALQQNDKMLEAWRALAEVDEHTHNWQELAASLRRVTELDKNDAKSRVQLAKLYLLGNAVDRALQMANAAVELEPNDPNVLALKGAVLLRLKDAEGAKQAVEAALKIDPTNADANAILATERFQRGDDAGALAALANVPAAHKDDIGLLLLKVTIYDHMKNSQQVESLLKRLVALHPKQNSFRSQLIRFYIAHERPDDAVEALRSYVTENPTDVNAELQLVGLLASVKSPAAAQEELEARIKAGGKVLPYQIALAKLEFARGNIAASIALLKKLTQSSNRDDAITAKNTLAELYLTKNDFAAAEPVVEDVLGEDSRNTDALRLRAVIRLNKGKTDDAIADLRRALNDQPRSPPLLATLALAYERSGAIELADKAYLDATKDSGYSPVYGLNYITFLDRRGLSDQAQNILTELARRNPTNVTVLSALARSRLAHQDWEGAQKIADAIHSLDKKSILPNQINAAALAAQNKLNDSLSLLQSAYNQDPSYQPMATLVATYIRAGQIDKAEAFIQAVLKANPHNAEAYIVRGGLNVAKKDPKQAESDFQAAIKQAPKSELGYQALARFYMAQNKADQAMKIIREGIEHQPKSFALRLFLAGLLERSRDYDGAIAEYEAMLRDQPGSLVVANNLASLLSDHRSDKASLQKAQQLTVLLKDSPIPQLKDTIGWVHYRQGDYKSAVSVLEDAAAKLPNVAMVHYHLGMSYLATGEATKANEQFKKALTLSSDPDLKAKIDAALREKSEKDKS